MKVLLVHNDYGTYSGEESVVDEMAQMLRSKGISVVYFRTSSKGHRESLLGQISGFLNGIYSFSGVRGMKNAILAERPDLVHVHNLYPFISPAALHVCHSFGIPVVMTVHNYRIMCPTGLFLRDGKPCELCRKRHCEWQCIRNNCENSLVRSIGYALRNASARIRNDYQYVDQFVCLTHFQRSKLIDYGIAPDRTMVIPNSYDVTPSLPEIDNTAPADNYIAFVGRISREKGYDLLIEAARRLPHIQFKVAGSVRDDVEFQETSNLRLMGHLDKSGLDHFIANARFLISTSRCYEGFPVTVLEAASHKRTYIAPRHGGFPEIIDDTGLFFDPLNIDDLVKQICYLWDHPTLSAQLGVKAYQKLMEQYNSENISSQWICLYDSLIETKKRTRSI